MAIIGFLMTMSVAGIQFALKRSRDVQRQNAASSLEAAITSYYAENQKYPKPSDLTGLCGPAAATWPNGITVQVCNSGGVTGGEMSAGAIFKLVDTSTGLVKEYVQGSWSWGPIPQDPQSIAYFVDTNGLYFAVCTMTEGSGSQKFAAAGTNKKFNGLFCKGTLASDVLKNCATTAQASVCNGTWMQ